MKSQVLEVHAPGDATVELAFRDEVTYYREPWLILYLFTGRICGPKIRRQRLVGVIWRDNTKANHRFGLQVPEVYTSTS